MIYKAPKSQGA